MKRSLRIKPEPFPKTGLFVPDPGHGGHRHPHPGCRYLHHPAGRTCHLVGIPERFPRDGMRQGGILPAIVGTFYLTLGTAIFSVPLGIAAAIYLSEYAPENRVTRLIRIAIINLAGIPSVVYGLFGLGLFVFFLKFGTSLLAASLTLSIMTLPVIISTTEEALRAVPQAFRTVSISLGGTRWQTIRRIVLPQALPGIITGVILGLERAAGETAPILFTGAAFFLPRLPNSPLDATMALPYHLFVISTQVPEMPFQIQYGTALVLLVFVLGMNMIATASARGPGPRGSGERL